MAATELFLTIGTVTTPESFVEGKGAGIYVYQLDPGTGNLTYVSTTGGLINPTFLAIAPGKNRLYAVNEISSGAGDSGRVSALAIDPSTHELTHLNSRSSQGFSPCHVSIDPTGRYLLTANYATGNLCVLPIIEDGRLDEASDIVQFDGSGPHARQGGPHAHMIASDPEGRFTFATDLGSDRIFVYRLDLDKGKLIPANTPWLRLEPGTGPRHLAFHPGGQFAYVIGELNSTVTALRFNGESGLLQPYQTISTLPDDYGGNNLGAEIQVTPSGRFVYASNRGHDSLAIFAVDQATGRLSITGHQATRGKFPRHFAIDPSGSLLLVANQDSDTVAVFKMDVLSGELQLTGLFDVPTPVCLRLHQPV